MTEHEMIRTDLDRGARLAVSLLQAMDVRAAERRLRACGYSQSQAKRAIALAKREQPDQ